MFNYLNLLDSPPPGGQSQYDRWSLVYFTRPGNSVVLRALEDESAVIREAVKSSSHNTINAGETAEEWFIRRIKNQRLKNRVVSVLCLILGYLLIF